jgi:glyoxylase-like metal-dependent hydrolase (beta-lactamase superfamily II)
VADRLLTLPDDGTVPHLPEWRYYHTPGHAPGHVSLFRQRDRLLLAGDAFITTNQESAFSVLMQERKMHGPPKYFTYNWISAERSVKMLADLEPEIAATGHGKPMAGEELRQALHHLADNFRELAVPRSGRYIDEPALVNYDGVQFIPPARNRKLLLTMAGITTAALVGFFVARNRRRFI